MNGFEDETSGEAARLKPTNRRKGKIPKCSGHAKSSFGISYQRYERENARGKNTI